MSPEGGKVLFRQGVRLAAAVTLGLTIEVTRGAALPFLAPMIALQLLAASPVLPTAGAVAMLLAVSAGAALLAYGVATLTLSVPGGYALGMLLLYLWGFALCFIPRFRPAGSLAVTLIVVVSALSSASTGLALGLVGELVLAILGGIGLAIVAHAAFPNPPGFVAPAPSGAAQVADSASPAALIWSRPRSVNRTASIPFRRTSSLK